MIVRRAALFVAAAFLLPELATAQPGVYERPVPTIAQALVGNALIGGVTAAMAANISGKNGLRAFAVGAIGGAVHFAGKAIGVGRAPVAGLAGLAVGAVGTSMVANAAQGRGPFEELTFPVASLRLRVTPRNSHRVHVAVNALETATIVGSVTRSGLAMDWRRSMLNGTVVMNTKNRHIVLNGMEESGLQGNAVVVISSFADDHYLVLRHELTHVQQERFITEAWGRPLEDYARRRVPGAGRLPGWIEVGVGSFAIYFIDHLVGGDNDNGPITRPMEDEARMFERR